MSAEDCCQEYFAWDLQGCRKRSIKFMWYPNPELIGGAGCINDGYEAEYHKRYTQYLFDTELQCCAFYFPYNVEGCMEEDDEKSVKDPCADEFKAVYLDKYNEDFLLESETGYYPTWNGSDNAYCVNDGNAPAYMLTNPQFWKYPTLFEW